MGDTDQEPITLDIIKNLTGEQFNERIISLPVFNCKTCFKRLTQPITLVKDFGNVCGSCSSNFDSSVSTPNSALMTILDNLILPCTNGNNGCKEKMNHLDISKHESICDYGIYNCPLSLIGGCAWGGYLSGFLSHFIEEHSNSVSGVLLQAINHFRLVVNVSEAAEMFKLLYINLDHFILRIRWNSEELKLQFVMYHIKKKKDVLGFCYSVVIEDHKIANKVLQASNITPEFDETKTISVSLKPENLPQNKIVRVLIKIVPEDNWQKEIDEKLLKSFECPICDNYLKTPIYMCLNGHSLCNICKSQLQECPTCRIQFNNLIIRNYALEQLSNDIPFPCLYQDQGCLKILPGSALVKHELKCSFQTYQCPMFECILTDTHAVISDHLKAFHKDYTVFGKYLTAHLIYNGISPSEKYCMVTYDHTFLVKCKLGSKMLTCSVWLVGPKGDANQYKYIFSVHHLMEKRIQWTELCQDISNESEFMHLKIPLKMVKDFLQEDILFISVKIVKVEEEE